MSPRRVVGLLTLCTLILIAFGISGVQLPVPGGGSQAVGLPGVKAVAALTVAHAPSGGQLAFMAVDPSGNLVVSDARRASILRFDPAGDLLGEWGPDLGGIQLDQPAGVAVFGGSYYVLDRGTPRILRLDSTGHVQALFDLTSLSTYGLNGLAVDANGNLYAADTGRNRVLVFSPDGQFLKQVGHAGSDLGGFTQPMMLAFASDGSFFVADWENGRIERFSPDYQATDAWTLDFRAFGVAVDGLGRVFAPDFERKRIDAYTPQGVSLGEIGADSPIIEVAPKQIAIAPGGQPSVYVLGDDAIQRIDLSNIAAPPQSGGATSTDLVSIVAIVLMLALVAFAVVSRRQRRAASVHSALEGPIRLDAKDGAQRQQQQAAGHEDLLISNQPRRE
jgi:sugar lactone lactonase YvrE